MNALQHLGTLALIVASPLAILLYVALGPLVHRSPEAAPDVSHLDTRDGLGRCQQRTCPGPALFNVTDGEGKPRRVCSACFELGWRLGWWVSFADRQPYDQEVAG